MTFNASAASLIRHGHARVMDVQEGLDLLEQARDRNLVQFGENVREGVNFICNCCSCCCEAMIAARKFGRLNPVHTTNFLPEVDAERCNGCGKCVAACPVEALTLAAAGDPDRPERRRAQLDEDICLGCGVCVRACSRDGLSLKSRAARVITPVNSTHRVVLMAIERGDPAGPHLRPAGVLEPPRAGRGAGRDPAAAAGEAGAGFAAVQVAVPRESHRALVARNIRGRDHCVGRNRPPGSTPGGRFILSARSSATSATPSSSSRRTTAPSGDRSTYRWAPAAPGRSRRTR
jgi:ferredoxin